MKPAIPHKPSRKGSVPCPHCAAMVQAVRLDRHIQRNHSELLAPVVEPVATPVKERPKASLFKTCPVCGKTMHRRFLAEHKKQHEIPKIPKE